MFSILGFSLLDSLGIFFSLDFVGVEDVVTDCKTHKVVVKGKKADPVKVLERVQRKSHRQVELISPIPKPPEPEAPPKAEEKAVPKVEEKKEEVITNFFFLLHLRFISFRFISFHFICV